MNFNLSPGEATFLLIIAGTIAAFIMGAIIAWICERLMDRPEIRINDDCKKDKKPRYLRGPFK